MRRSGETGATTTRRRALPAAALLVVVLCTLAAPPAARAERLFTAQAAFANALDAAWIAPPAQPAAVCIVDSGVDVNPDTANVVARFAADNGDPGDVSTHKHGTTMAMIATAPYNGWGMFGVAPSVKVVSVRAMSPGNEETFSPPDVTDAIRMCAKWRSKYNIKVVSLSLGGQWGPALDEQSIELLEDAVAQARRYGLNVLAAAGNHPGPVDWPAAYGPVFAVGAAGADGGRCTFAASGPQVDLWAAGCPLDVAMIDGRSATTLGSSGATAFTAAGLTELRGLRPDLSADQAEDLLRLSASSTAAGPALDLASTLVAAGLDEELHQAAITRAAGMPAEAHPSGTAAVLDDESGSTPVAEPTLTVRLARPQLRSFRVRRGAAVIVLRRKPKPVQAIVRVYAQAKGKPFPTLLRTVRTHADRIRVRTSGTITQLSISYRDPTGRYGASAPLIVRPR